MLPNLLDARLRFISSIPHPTVDLYDGFSVDDDNDEPLDDIGTPCPEIPIYYFQHDGALAIICGDASAPTRRLLKNYLPDFDFENSTIVRFSIKKRRIPLSRRTHAVA